MSFSAVIGNLRANLGLDTAQFDRGLDSAQSSLARAGQRMQRVGQRLSTRITAPLAGAAGGLAASLGVMSNNLADLGNQAKLAGVGVEEFQKLAFASKTVGIEQDKLSDILKDVNDKVGDFLATGGGELKDFFETVAPKVGITADAFRGLNSRDALQLYVSTLQKAGVSQQEMTFYLEAIADEASALAPLLADNGAELEALSSKAEKFGVASDDTVASAKAFKQSMSGLRNAVSSLGRALIDSGVLDTLAQLTEKAAGWVVKLQDINPKIVKFGAVVAGLAAAIGPVAIALGFMATGLAAIASPIGLVIVGLGALGGAAAYVAANWDSLTARFPALDTALKTTKQVASNLWTIFRNAGVLAMDAFEAKVKVVRGVLNGDFSLALQGVRDLGQSVADFFRNTFPDLVNAIVQVSADARAGGQQIVQSISDGVTGFFSAIGTAFVDLKDYILARLKAIPSEVAESAKEIGRNIVSGIVSGITGGAPAVGSASRKATRDAIRASEDEAQIKSPSREFMRIGREMMAGAALGIDGAAGRAVDASRGAAKAAAEAMEGGASITGPTRLEQGINSVADAMGRAIVQGQNMGQALAQVFQQIASSFISNGINQLFSSVLGGLFGGGKSPIGNLGGGTPIPGNANGTNNWRGGWTTVGERGRELVNLPRGSQVVRNADTEKMLGAGGQSVMRVELGEGLVGQILQEAGNQSVQLVQASAKAQDRNFGKRYQQLQKQGR